jgi:signal transduction histidine kinase
MKRTLLHSLSARLLLWTIFFVMLSEVLIFAPSIARFRVSWFEERLAAAHLAGLSVDATPDRMVSRELAAMLLDHVGAYVVDLYRGGRNTHMLARTQPRPVQATYDLRQMGFFGLIADAFETLAQAQSRVLRIIGPSPKDPDVLVEVVLEEGPLRAAMLYYSERILALSIVISVITASLVFLILQVILVNPMRRITESMVAFRDDPENTGTMIGPTRRNDEIGTAMRVLADMQESLRAFLRQKTRLAALGTAVAKISHDLRGTLATAQLVSDRLVGSEHPEVRRIAPTLVDAIDRAIGLCSQTLDFIREGQPPMKPSRFPLAPLVIEVGQALGLGTAEDPEPKCRLDNQVDGAFELQADRNQIYRVLINLLRNAADAGARTVRISAKRGHHGAVVTVADDGPGIPAKAQERLFQPFTGSVRPGGTGLGLAIVRDLLRAHGGDILLAATGADGTQFRLHLPDMPLREAE